MGDALGVFTHEPRWVTWRIEDRRGRPTKIPYHPTGRLAKSDDQTTWDTREFCEVYAQAVGGDIGIMLGDLGGDQYLAGLDLDSCLDINGNLAGWAQPFVAAISSYTEVSPSGKGLKVFFYIESGLVRLFLEANGIHNPTQWGFSRSIPGERSKADHGPGVELYTSHRFFAVTDQLWPGQPNRVTLLDWEALERLTQVIPVATDEQRTATESAAPKANGHDNSRSAAAYRKGFELRRAGKSYDEFVDTLQADPETSSWVREKGLDNGQRELRRIWEKAEPNDADAKYTELAALPLDEYDHQRNAAARQLGIRPSTLDELVKAKRKLITVGAANQPGRQLKLPDPEPWLEPINGPALLDNIATQIKRYVILGDNEARATTLWVVAVHAFKLFKIFPRLLIAAAEKGCGKTTLLEVVFHQTPRPLMASNATPASLFRIIEQARPTFLLDEADTFLRDNEDMRGIVDAGHKFDGAIIRCVETKDGYEPRVFSVWSPVVLATIGHLPSTIEDRSIRIGLRRRTKDEAVETLRIGQSEHLEIIARQAARWVKDNSTAIAAANPTMPSGIINRQADNWAPLFAVADVMCPRWAEMARNAATKISGSGGKSQREILIADLQALFNTPLLDNDRTFTEQIANPFPRALFTREILEFLNNRDDRPWPEYKDGNPLTGPQLARLLKPLDVPTKNTVRRGKEVAKGYYREDFEDAFKRYGEADGSVTPNVTPVTPL